MTITPTAAAGVLPAGAADLAGSSNPAGAGDFLALVQQALAGALGTEPDEATAAPVDAEGVDDPALAVLAAGLATGPAPVPLGKADRATAPGTSAVLAVPAVPGVPDATAAPTAPAGPAAPGHADVTPGADVTGSSPVSDIRMFGDAAAATTPTIPTPPATAPANSPAAAARSTDVAASPAAPAPAGPTAPAGPATPVEADSATAQPLVAQETPAAAPASAATAGLGQPVPATATTTAAGPGAPAAQHVTGQVFPEVTSLVSRGDGTHRITLTLNPEALGEVRVVMTVRDGAVHVRLAAGQDARQALVEGSPELTRLLELAGASESRIVVRDLPAGSAASTGSGTPDRGSDPGAELGTGAGRSQDQHAGTRADNPATDGMHDGTTRQSRTIRGADGATQPRSNEPVTDARTAGVDVTM